MDVTWIYGAVAIGGIIVTAISGERYRRKYKKLQADYNKRCKELTNALGEISKAQESQLTYQPFERLNRQLLKDNNEYMLLCSHGFLNLKARVDFQINNDERCGAVAVMGTIHETDKEFIVKVFTYKLNDPEDREFAIREAEELIETINKA